MNYIELEKYISNERLDKYKKIILANNNNINKEELEKETEELYKLNLYLSSQYYILLSNFEIILRNVVNIEIEKVYGKDWLNNFDKIINEEKKYLNNYILNQEVINKTLIKYEKYYKITKDYIVEAIEKRTIYHKDIINSSILSELTFGFWTNLFKTYYSSLYQKCLINIFNKKEYNILKKKISNNRIKNKPKDIITYITDLLNKLRMFRNRIAHNECIIKMNKSIGYNLIELYDKIFEMIRLINPNLENWIKNQLDKDLEEKIRSVIKKTTQD